MGRTTDASARVAPPAPDDATSPARRRAGAPGAVLLAAAALLLLARLGATGLWAPDEPRYGQVAEELRSGRHGPAGLVLLHLDGEPYTQKPPLYFWLAAAAGLPDGRVHELDARLPSALAGIALVLLVGRFGARSLAPATGALAAALLLTTFEFADEARRARLDVLLALFESAALALFWRIDRRPGRPPPALVAGMHGCLGLAVLTKGPVGFLVPLLVMAAFLAWERRLRDLRRVLPAWAFALSVAPGLAWIAGAVALAPSGFFDEAVVENVIGRVFEGTAHPRPVWYYLYALPLGFLPWILLAPLALPAGRRALGTGADPAARRAWRFLLVWVLVPLAFFTLSAGKRGIYLLPCHPALALLVADALRREVERRGALPDCHRFVSMLLAFGLAAAGAWTAAADPLRDAAASTITGVAGVAVGAALAAAIVALPGRVAPLAAATAPIAAVWGVLFVVFTVTWPALDAEKSPRAVARAAAALTPPDGAIGLVGDRALEGGLVYYGDRRVARLEGAGAVADFFARGGRAVVVQERKLARVEAARPVVVCFRAREGRRALVVVSPRCVDGRSGP